MVAWASSEGEPRERANLKWYLPPISEERILAISGAVGSAAKGKSSCPESMGHPFASSPKMCLYLRRGWRFAWFKGWGCLA
jgi:hypothetical protein